MGKINWDAVVRIVAIITLGFISVVGIVYAK